MTEHRDLLARLGAALRADAARARTDPAALALIRAAINESGRRAETRAARLLRPALAGAALTFTLVLGTLAGGHLGAVDRSASEGLAGAPTVSTLSEASAIRVPLHRIPPDDGGTYVAITAPDSGSVVDPTFDLRGLARVRGGGVTVEASQNGTVLATWHADVRAAPAEPAEWTARLTLEPGAYRVESYAGPGGQADTRAAIDTIWVTVAVPPRN